MKSEFFPNLVVVDHPLVRDKMTRLRSAECGVRDFREFVREATALVAYEALREVGEEAVAVRTPLELSVGSRVPARTLASVVVLRAGLGMIEAVERLVPGIAVGHVGMERDHETLEASEYCFKVPPGLESRHVLVLDPMLGTGGTATAVVTGLKKRGARSLAFICLVTCPEGALAFQSAHPDVSVHTASFDRELSRSGYILPGLGDAGDRLFGTEG
ncbi:MAG: uracil phosphoribosyltransferase [Gemmatimonadetes bacterium]|nr:uracil phosphoribosyltransferase [Gemmatimonadota bacterium]